jgi:hypothetical protein
MIFFLLFILFWFILIKSFIFNIFNTFLLYFSDFKPVFIFYILIINFVCDVFFIKNTLKNTHDIFFTINNFFVYFK